MYREFKLLELQERLKEKMGEHDNSVNKYKNTLITSGQEANNFNRTGSGTVPGGRQDSVKYQNIMSGSPTIDWNKYSSKDPITVFGSTSGSLKGQNFISTLSNVASIFTLVGGAAVTGLSIAAAVKSMKGSKNNSNTPSADANLAGLTQKANNLDKKSNLDDIGDLQAELIKAKGTAQKELTHAEGVVKTATITLNNLHKQKTEAKQQLTDFKLAKEELTSSIQTNETQLSELESIPEDQRTPEINKQINDLRQNISTAKEKLKNEYSDAKQKQMENNIQSLEDRITKMTNLKLENEILLKQLPAEIQEADKAIERLNSLMQSK